MSEKSEYISIITPTFNEEKNLPVFYQHLVEVMTKEKLQWEWIIVDDHSYDHSFSEVHALHQTDERVKGIRLSRNCGSHHAIFCGLKHCCGNAAVVMAADMQDPPKEISSLIAEWRKGIQLVWAVRKKREKESTVNLFFSRFYYWLMKKMVRLKDMPATGADFFLADRIVINAVMRFRELNTSIFALLVWMGFRQSAVLYDKQARLYGSSGWSLRKKIKLVVDSVICFSFLPIRILSIMGIFFAGLGIIYATVIFINAICGQFKGILGWPSLMIVILVIGGLQMLMLGIIGEYLWRTLEETRCRPRYLEEAVVGEMNQPSPGPEERGNCRAGTVRNEKNEEN